MTSIPEFLYIAWMRYVRRRDCFAIPSWMCRHWKADR